MDGTSVLVAGGASLDIIGAVDRLPDEHEKLRAGSYVASAGGSAVHTACTLARLGVRTELVSTVGDDPFGEVCLAGLEQDGVGTRLVRRVAGARTGLAVIFSTGPSKRMVTYAGPEGSAAYAAVRDLDRFQHLHVTGEATDALADLVARAHAAGCSVSAEWNGRDLSRLAPIPAVNFMNSDELRGLTGCKPDQLELEASRLAGHLRAEVVVTLGARGALYAGPLALRRRAARPVEPVDRTGGGDAFDAGYLVAHLHGLPVDDRLDAGLRAAADKIMRVGR